MSRRPGQRNVLYEGGPALKELIETYATMNIKAFCAKWGLLIATVHSTASRRGFTVFVGNRLKSAPPTRIRAFSVPCCRSLNPKPRPYRPTNRQNMIPPSLLKRVKGKRRGWKLPTRREELNCMPVPYPFCLQSDLRFTKAEDKVPAESHISVKHTKNR